MIRAFGNALAKDLFYDKQSKVKFPRCDGRQDGAKNSRSGNNRLENPRLERVQFHLTSGAYFSGAGATSMADYHWKPWTSNQKILFIRVNAA